MYPQLSNFDKWESGIKRVVEAYYKYAPQYGIQYVKDTEDCDVVAIHAGMATKFDKSLPMVAHCHGLYWTADYSASAWEWRANADVVWSLWNATLITVPSDWVAETIRRDMRIDPVVIHHGIEADEWRHNKKIAGHVLWNKNRNADVCDPRDVGALAKISPEYRFMTTFKPEGAPNNVSEIGLIDHDKMKSMIQTAGVYLSTTKETFGIGVLEALASGTPVLGYDFGGNKIMVEHGVNGYLARPGDIDDLKNGLEYCRQNRYVLSENAKHIARRFSWSEAMAKVSDTYRQALRIASDKNRPFKIDESLYKIK